MNGYDFDIGLSATLSDQVIKEMITRIVEEQTGKTVARVEFNVETITKGWQREENTVTTFNGATVYFEGGK